MPIYQNSIYFKQVTLSAFDKLHETSDSVKRSGIYRCEGCGHEITAVAGKLFTSRYHKEHTPLQGPIRWRLVCSHGPNAS